MSLVAILIAVGLLALALVQARQASRLARWPTATGRVVSAALEDGPPRGRPIPVASHRAVISYTYEVAGKEWVAHRVFVGDEEFRPGDGARDRVRKYEPGSVVQVYYDPRDPSKAVLEPFTPWPETAKWIGLAVVSVGAVFIAQCWAR
jgi:hypothetical protein